MTAIKEKKYQPIISNKQMASITSGDGSSIEVPVTTFDVHPTELAKLMDCEVDVEHAVFSSRALAMQWLKEMRDEAREWKRERKAENKTDPSVAVIKKLTKAAMLITEILGDDAQGVVNAIASILNFKHQMEQCDFYAGLEAAIVAANEKRVYQASKRKEKLTESN